MTDLMVYAKPAGLPVPWQAVAVSHGKNIEEMVLELYGTLDGISAFVRGNGVSWEEVPRSQWKYVRPRVSEVLRFSFLPRGGGGKNLFATIASIALAVVVTTFAPYLSAALGPVLGSLATVALGVGGSFLINRLFPTETGIVPGQKQQDSRKFSDVDTDQNPFGRDDYLPIVAGSRRVSPPDIAEPRFRILDSIETVERVFGFYGKHSLTNIQVNKTGVDDFSAITTAVLDGDEEDGTYTFIDRVTKSESIAEALNSFAVQSGTVLEDQTMPSNSEPRWLHFSTPGHDRLEEVIIKLQIQSLYRTTSETDDVYIPTRIQFRPKGGGSGDWVSLPEIHFRGRSTNIIKQELRIRWDEDFDDETLGGEISHHFWVTVPAAGFDLSDGSSGVQWQSAAHFDNGSGNRNKKNIYSARRGVHVFLDETLYPKGPLEWRIMRGAGGRNSSLDTSTYEISGAVESLFLGRRTSGSAGNWAIIADQASYPGQIGVVQSSSIADEHPCQLPGTAQIALRSKGQSIKGVTVEAARYVMDWDGAAWATETAASRNPATHYRHLLVEFLQHFGLDTDTLVPDAPFVAWRQECIDRSYECSAVFSGETIGEMLLALAIAGFARPVFSDSFGIDYFRDRSSETPEQTFTPRNTSSIRFSIQTPVRQAGFRVKFDNEDLDYREDEIEVTLDNAADNGSFEAIAYRAIANESLARRRATFDLLQVDYQNLTWEVECSMEGIVASVGELVYLATDLLDDTAHGTRVLEVIDAKTLRIDQRITPSESTSFTDPIADILTAGVDSVAFVHTSTGVEMKEIVAVDGNVIELVSNLSTLPVAGTHVAITTLTNSRRRCVIKAIAKQSGDQAIVTLVDESPEIYEELERLFG